MIGSRAFSPLGVETETQAEDGGGGWEKRTILFDDGINTTEGDILPCGNYLAF